MSPKQAGKPHAMGSGLPEVGRDRSLIGFSYRGIIVPKGISQKSDYSSSTQPMICDGGSHFPPDTYQGVYLLEEVNVYERINHA